MQAVIEERTTADVDEYIRELAKRNGGNITPQIVIDDAMDEDSPLHSHFTWDDAEAGHQWRVEQARRLIRRVRLEVTIEEQPVRAIAFVSNPKDSDGESSYVNVMRVSKPDARAIMLREVNAIAALVERTRTIAASTAEKLPPNLGKRLAAIAAITAEVADMLE